MVMQGYLMFSISRYLEQNSNKGVNPDYALRARTSMEKYSCTYAIPYVTLGLCASRL